MLLLLVLSRVIRQSLLKWITKFDNTHFTYLMDTKVLLIQLAHAPTFELEIRGGVIFLTELVPIDDKESVGVKEIAHVEVVGVVKHLLEFLLQCIQIQGLLFDVIKDRCSTHRFLCCVGRQLHHRGRQAAGVAHGTVEAGVHPVEETPHHVLELHPVEELLFRVSSLRFQQEGLQRCHVHCCATDR